LLWALSGLIEEMKPFEREGGWSSSWFWDIGFFSLLVFVWPLEAKWF